MSAEPRVAGPEAVRPQAEVHQEVPQAGLAACQAEASSCRAGAVAQA